MKITGLPAKRISKQDAATIELEFANFGFGSYFDEDGELILVVDAPDATLDEVLCAKSGEFNWIIGRVLEKIASK